jgi:glutamate racemase
LDSLRATISTPIVGVVPAIKPAARLTQTRTIGLLATEATVTRSYTDDLISSFAGECKVVKVGASKLVHEAEEKLRGREVDKKAIKTDLDQLFNAVGGDAIDTVVLGCTHFPLLVEELTELAPRKIKWVDSGEPIAKRVNTLLADIPATKENANQPNTAYFTAKNKDVEELRPALSKYGLTSIKFITDFN